MYAKNKGGTFVLRIEDTDLERSTEASEQLIYEDLRWLGLTWDEGEGIGGDYGPYRQTERFGIYEGITKELLSKGHAYHCFCSKEELEASREKSLAEGRPPLYNVKCRNLSADEVKRRLDAGEKAAIRFKVTEEIATVKDLIHGVLSFQTNTFGDFIIVRPDGAPLYNYAVVIDDAMMRITHVIRGDDHLSNTPKQVLMFQALGYPTPLFAHIPMILGADRSKLSKRHGNTSVEQFRKAGYLPEAMLNFMAFLSWTPEGTEDEIFPIDELVKRFSLERVSSSAAVFDFDKLKWMNGMYIRAAELSRIAELCVPYLLESGQIDQDFADKHKSRLEGIIASVRDNLEVLSDISTYTPVYFCPIPEPDADAREILDLSTTRAVLTTFLRLIDSHDHLCADEYKAKAKEVQTETGAKGKALYMALRVGMTGRTKGPELDQFVPLMPVAELKERLKTTIDRI
jgi:glutamyl-tRNA synthetase